MCYTDRCYENLGKGVRGKLKGMVKVKAKGGAKDNEGKDGKGLERKGKERKGLERKGMEKKRKEG